MTCNSLDLTIEGVLADPMIAAVMRADRVEPQRFEALLRSKARTLGDPRASRTMVVAALTSRFGRSACGAAA